MMPVVRINDGTFGDLKSISTWLGTKTPSETIDTLVREKLESLGMERDFIEGSEDGEGSMVSTLNATPSLAFTKILRASVDGREVSKRNWASVLLRVIEKVKSTGMEKAALSDELHVPNKAYEFNDDGYRFYPDLGLSIQGQSAPDAWREAERLSKKFRIPVTVEFQWRNDPKALYPGKIGRLCVNSE